MFKRIEKRRRRKEEEAESGLNEELKEIIGLNDTDSDESISEPDSTSRGSEAGVIGEEENLVDSEEGSDEDLQISVAQALVDPIFVVSLSPDVNACIVCPGKQLKGEKMVQLHRTSNACTAHERRFKRFKMRATASRTKNALEVIRSHGDNPGLPASGNALSRRAQKLASFRERRNLRRKAIQEKRAAQRAERSIAATAPLRAEELPTSLRAPQPKDKVTDGDLDNSSNRPQSKKKRRIDDEVDPDLPSVNSLLSSPNAPKKRKKVVRPESITTTHPGTSAQQTKNRESIINIVRSTIDRAKTARLNSMMIRKKI